jgi:hypothetical protein
MTSVEVILGRSGGRRTLIVVAPEEAAPRYDEPSAYAAAERVRAVAGDGRRGAG